MNFIQARNTEAPGFLGLREAMRLLPGGVSVITAGVGDDVTGATVTTAHSLSVAPETMVISINLGSSTWPVIERYRHFCVNILGDTHQPIADRFAGKGGVKGRDRYRDARWAPLVTGALALEDALAAVDCEVEDFVERHSHALVFGRVRAVATGRGGNALVYGNGRYQSYAL